ncbi:acyltransferase family protein [Pseudomonas sp. UBA4194]|uniref:acyltransferase family protein n=1 Tax=Pseudomonas sp. UBA4194 TaxID=1947317 RepID=UPI0025DDF5B9|nr:acyltransferase [Pseudomonas sp. UBA4194]
MAQGERYHALDSLRGVCALAVVLYHLHVVGSITELPFFQSADLFVDFFFVLSGFVITHAYGNRRDLDFKKFFILRTFRLAPLHVVLLAAFILFEFVKWAAWQKGFAFNKEPFSGMYAPSQILPNLLLVQGWTTLTENLSFNYPSWSISIEYYMYLIFAALLMFSSVQRKVLWAGIALFGFVMLEQPSGLLSSYAYKGLSCFFAGALCHTVFQAASARGRPGFALASVLELCAFGLVVLVLSLPLPGKSLVASLLFCAVVTLFAFDAGVVSKVLKGGVFALLGRLSYSIYMTHVIILSSLTLGAMIVQKHSGQALAPLFGGVRYFDSGSVPINNLIVALVLLIVVAVSALTYRLIEMNGQRLGRFLLTARAPKTPALT